jgi:hypothetical protein
MDITATGVYYNQNKCQYEAWIVNQKTGEKRCIGTISEVAVEEHPESKKIWEKMVWKTILTELKYGSKEGQNEWILMCKVEQSDVIKDITGKILHSLYTLKAEGKNPKYCIMNHQTLQVIKNCVSFICLETLTVSKIYGLYIAICDALDFGDIEVR